jgi:hypothetical protein
MSGEYKDLEFALLDFLAAVEASARAAKEKIQELLEERSSIAWSEINAPKPLDQNDRAIVWMKKKIDEIRASHPELKAQLVTDAHGRITALRFRAPDGEVREDVGSVARWAFEKASMRPQTSEAANPKQASEGGRGQGAERGRWSL